MAYPNPYTRAPQSRSDAVSRILALGALHPVRSFAALPLSYPDHRPRAGFEPATCYSCFPVIEHLSGPWESNPVSPQSE